GRAGSSTGIGPFVAECLRRVPEGVLIRARFDSAFYSSALFSDLERGGVTYLCGVPHNQRLLQVIIGVPDEDYAPCIDGKEGELAEFGYRTAKGTTFRRYVVKRIAIAP